MPDLTKTRTVLPLASDRDTNEKVVIYQTVAEETDERLWTLHVDADVFDDMGCPEFVTLTLEPGDLLNTEVVDTYYEPEPDVQDTPPPLGWITEEMLHFASRRPDCTEIWVLRRICDELIERRARDE